MLTTEQICIPMKDKYKTQKTQVKASFTQVSILINILNWKLFVSNDPKSADYFSVVVTIMFLIFLCNPKCMFRLMIDTHSFTKSRCFSVFTPCSWFFFSAASGDVQTYQIRTAPTSTIAPGVVMASSPALPTQPAEEAARKREVRLMKNRYIRCTYQIVGGQVVCRYCQMCVFQIC